MDKKFIARIMANTSDFTRGIAKCIAAAEALDDDLKVTVDADTGAATAQLSRFRMMMKSIPNKIRVKADVDHRPLNLLKRGFKGILDANDRFEGKMQSLASSVRAFGTVIQNQFSGAIIMSVTAIIPIIAALIPAIMAIGNAIAVVGGGAIGLAGSFGIMYAGVGAFAGLAATALKMLEDGAIAASDATVDYNNSLKGLKDAWKGIVKQNADGIFTTMANGLKVASQALKALTPFIEGVIDRLTEASSAMLEWMTSSGVAKDFFKMMGSTGVNVFSDILSGLGKFGSGFIKLFTSFAPLFTFMSKGLSNMGADFEQWTNKVSTTEGIKNFIDYTKQNLPVIGKIFGDTFLGIFNLFKAFAPNSQSIFDALSEMTGKFKSWSETVGNSEGFKSFIDYIQTNGPTVISAIGGIIGVIVAFVEAVAPIGQKVLEAVTQITSFVTELLKAYPIIGQVAGVASILVGAFKLFVPAIMGAFEFLSPIVGLFSEFAGVLTPLLSPIGLVVGALVLLGGALFVLYQKHELFRNLVQQAWEAIKTAITTAATAVWNFLVQIFEKLTTWFQTNQENIKNIFTNVWNAILVVASAFIALLAPIFITGWETIKAAIQIAWELIKAVIMTALDIILGVLQAFMQILNGDFAGAWETIKNTISNVWNNIKELITNVIEIIGNAIKSWATNIINVVGQAFTDIYNRVKSTWDDIANAILLALARAVAFVVNGFSKMISAVIDFASNLVSNIGRAMADFISKVQEGATNAVKAITDGCSRMISGIAGFVGDMASAGADLVRGFINGIQNMAGEAVNAARRMASDAVAQVKSFLKIGSPSKVLKQIGQWLTQGFALGIEKDIPKVATAIERMLRPVKEGLAKLKSRDYDTSKGGASEVYGFINDRIKKATDELKKLADKRKSVMEKIKKTQADLRKNMKLKTRIKKNKELAALQKQWTKLGKTMKVKYKTRSTDRKLRDTIRPLQIYGTRVAKKREQIADKIAAAKDKLQAALEKKTEFKTSMLGDLKGYGSIMATDKKTSAGMIKVMKKRLEDIKKYQATIGSLKKMGLNNTTLKEILDAGIEQGSSIAAGLFKGGKTAIKEVNKLQKELGSVATKTADTNAKYFFQAGIDMAKGVVNGLEKQDAVLKKVADKIANTILSTIKKRLKIKSPSRKAIELMNYFGQGAVNGLLQMVNPVNKASLKLTKAVEEGFRPEMELPQADLGADIGQINKAITSDFNSTVSHESDDFGQNITIIMKSDMDIEAITHEIEHIQGVRKGVKVFQ